MGALEEFYRGYKWIKVPRYEMDELLSWEERYRRLDEHHVRETTFLIEEVRRLAVRIDELQRSEG